MFHCLCQHNGRWLVVRTTNAAPISPTAAIRAYESQRASAEEPLPALKSAAAYGNHAALEFMNVDDAQAAEDLEVPFGDKMTFVLKRNRSATATVYEIRQTSLAPIEAVLKGLERAFPVDNFKLYQGVVMGVPVDEWVVQFESPPATADIS